MSASPDFEGEFVLTEGGERMPMTYTLQAVKAVTLGLCRPGGSSPLLWTRPCTANINNHVHDSQLLAHCLRAPTLGKVGRIRVEPGRSMNVSKRLSPGRHQLSRDEVKENQRERIFAALETVMSAKGYFDTSVADIIKRAGVSRQTFYELFCSKQDCFLASFGRRQAAVVEAIVRKAAGRARRWFGSQRCCGPTSRSWRVDPDAVPPLPDRRVRGGLGGDRRARSKMQQQFVDGIAEVFDARVGAGALRVPGPRRGDLDPGDSMRLLDDDPQAVLNLYEPLIGCRRKLMAAVEATT